MRRSLALVATMALLFMGGAFSPAVLLPNVGTALAAGKGNGEGNKGGDSSRGESGGASAAAGSQGGGNSADKGASVRVDENEGMGGSRSAERATKSEKDVAGQFARAVNAELKELNSLKRNIDGLMNSSSPKFAAIRDYVQKSATFELAKIALEAADVVFRSAAADYQNYARILSLSGDPVQDTAALQSWLDMLNAEPLQPGAEGFEQWSADVAVLTEAFAVVASYQQAQADLVEAQSIAMQAAVGTSEMDLAAALAAAANPSGDAALAEITLSRDALERAKGLLGFGEPVGLIDAYVAKLQ